MIDLPGYTRWLDPQGELVATDRFPTFQEALRRFHPELVLAFDRTDGFWKIVRQDTELVELEDVAFPRPFWTIVYGLAWVTRDPDTHEHIPHYREPSWAVLDELAMWKQMGHHDRFTHDSTKTISKIMNENTRKRDEEARRRACQFARDVVHELGPQVGKIAVPVPKVWTP